MANKISEIAFKAGALERETAACITKLAKITAAKEDEMNQGGGRVESLASEESAEREKLSLLSKDKANAMEGLTGAPVESVLAALEVKEDVCPGSGRCCFFVRSVYACASAKI